MDTKEKVSTLVEMGFTVDEAISLAKGNYRTVPDPKPGAAPEPGQSAGTEPGQSAGTEPGKPSEKQEPGTDPGEGKTEPAQNTGQNEKTEPWERIEQALAKLTQSVINSNINNKQQPTPMNAQDVLGLMLEPAKPAERSK